MEQTKSIAKYKLAIRTGARIGQYGEKVFVSIEAVDPMGNRVYLNGARKSPFLKTRGWWYSHYRTGMSKADMQSFSSACAELGEQVRELNAKIERGE